MSAKVCLFANTLQYPSGGHVWVYLNWALGLRANGCDVFWLELNPPEWDREATSTAIAALRRALEPYDFADRLVLTTADGCSLQNSADVQLLTFDDVCEGAQLLLNFQYGASPAIVGRFKRSALVDIDPGLLQIWMSERQLEVAEHDVYFTTGENIGRAGSLVPDTGVRWHYAPPCVALQAWPVADRVEPNAAFTTVSQWYACEWVLQNGAYYRNDKREGFLPFLDVARRVRVPLELALTMGDDEDEERRGLHQLGWRVSDPRVVAQTPSDYQNYIQHSLGEFSCVKPSCVKLQNAWISDRTLCYLASGKPAIVQHPGRAESFPIAPGWRDFARSMRPSNVSRTSRRITTNTGVLRGRSPRNILMRRG